MMQILAAVLLLFLLATGRTPAADFDGDSRDDVAVFRPSSGLWAVRGLTRVYFGTNGDIPSAADYTGDGIAEIGVFRKASGLWALRGVSRIYFGGTADTALTGGGGGQRLYDYVVRPNDGDDLERALESDSYDSVFIPAGTYTVSDPITVSHVTRIAGESRHKVIISFTGSQYLAISPSATGCTVERVTVQNGGFTNIGNFYVAASDATVRDCRSRYSAADGFLYTSGAHGVTFDNCRVEYAAGAGFCGSGAVRNSKLINCSVYDTGTVIADDVGFRDCFNLSNCYVDGEYAGYSGCCNISSSVSYNCYFYGFTYCYGLSGCQVALSVERPLYGMNSCQNLSACRVAAHVNAYNGCDYFYGPDVVGHQNSCN